MADRRGDYGLLFLCVQEETEDKLCSFNVGQKKGTKDVQFASNFSYG